jgi:hypothetical protein
MSTSERYDPRERLKLVEQIKAHAESKIGSSLGVTIIVHEHDPRPSGVAQPMYVASTLPDRATFLLLLAEASLQAVVADGEDIEEVLEKLDRRAAENKPPRPPQ